MELKEPPSQTARKTATSSVGGEWTPVWVCPAVGLSEFSAGILGTEKGNDYVRDQTWCRTALGGLSSARCAGNDQGRVDYRLVGNRHDAQERIH